MKSLVPYLFIALFFTACNNVDNTSKQEIKTDTPASVQQLQQPKTIADEFRPAGDSMILPPFEITVELSETAKKKLEDAKETIIVSAILSGVPTDTTLKEYQEWGEFALGTTQVEIPAPGTARFENAKILKSDFELLSSKDIKVLINVYSGRRSDPNNLLSCDILELPISQVRQQKNVLKGKLIYE